MLILDPQTGELRDRTRDVAEYSVRPAARKIDVVFVGALLAIEVDGFAFHEHNPVQLARDALKDQILQTYQIPLLRLPTTGSREEERIRTALDAAERHWAALTSR